MQAKAYDETKIESFDIIPSICIVAKETTCTQDILFSWQLNQADSSCLYQKNKSEPLFCSSLQNNAVALRLTLKRENEFIIRLTDRPQKNKRSHIAVRELGKDIRQSRRHLWSVF